MLGQAQGGHRQAKTQLALGHQHSLQERQHGHVHKSAPPRSPLAPHLSCHAGDEAGQDGPAQHVPAQAGVLGVFQVADPAPHPVAILHVRALQLLEDMWGSVKESRGQGGGMSAPWAPTAALGSVVLIDCH